MKCYKVTAFLIEGILPYFLVSLLKWTGTECVIILLGKLCRAAQSLLKRQ